MDNLVPEGRPDLRTGRTVNIAAQFRAGNTRFNMAALGLLKNMGFTSNRKRFTASRGRVRVYPPQYGDAPRLPPQDVTALVYHTGNVVLTGASSVQMARMAAWNLCLLFSSNGIEVEMRNFHVENVVATFSTGFYIDLTRFDEEQGALVKYNPEKFPAAIYRGEDKTNKKPILVYNTGSLVITGSRTCEEAIVRYVALCDILKQYRLDVPMERDYSKDLLNVNAVAHALDMMTITFEDVEGVPAPISLRSIAKSMRRAHKNNKDESGETLNDAAEMRRTLTYSGDPMYTQACKRSRIY